MTDRELDHILAEQPELQPTDAFTASVMRAVRQEAAMPPPLGFPWLLALPAIVAAGLTLLALILVPFYDPNISTAPVSTFSFDWAGVQYALALATGWFLRPEVAWISGALLLTVACVRVPLRLMRGR